MGRRGAFVAVVGLVLAGAGLILLAPGARAGDCPVPSLPSCSAPTTTVPTLPPSTTTTTQPPRPRPAPDTAAAARRLLELVNAERTARGLPALARRGDIDAIAVRHSTAMAAKYDIWHNDGYFTPTTKSSLGAVFVGENVAMNPGIENMHKRLMNSPHHRDNILDARFTQVGIGVAAAPDGELFATEDFAQPRAVAAPRPTPVRPAAVKTAAPAAVTVPTTAQADSALRPVSLDADAVMALPGGMAGMRGAVDGSRRRPLPVALVGLGLVALVGAAGGAGVSAFRH